MRAGPAGGGVEGRDRVIELTEGRGRPCLVEVHAALPEWGSTLWLVTHVESAPHAEGTGVAVFSEKKA